MGSKYSKGDAAKDTDSSRKETSAAWHEARNDSGARTGGDKSALQANAIERDLASTDGILDWLFGGKS